MPKNYKTKLGLINEYFLINYYGFIIEESFSNKESIIMKNIIGTALLASTILSGCGMNNVENTIAINTTKDVAASYNSINKVQLIQHIKVLASDEFEGRAPSSKGEKLTLDYLTKQLTAIGFKPGNGDSFLQAVPMVSIEASPDMSLLIGGKNYQYGADMVMGSSRIIDAAK